MKQLIASFLLIAPALAMVTTAHAATSKPAETKKTAAVKKPSVDKKKTVVKKSSAPVAAAAGAGAATAAIMAPRALSAGELALAERVHTGRIACELGQHVNVAKDSSTPGHFLVSGNGFNFHMSPVGTSTGVVRLEDMKAGAVWLQIANKSMLMNQKQGKRLADECMSPEQLQVAEAIKKTPPPSLLDAPGK